MRSGLRLSFVMFLALAAAARSQSVLPVVSSIRFDGASAANASALRQLAELSEGSVLEQSAVERDVGAMLAHYGGLGYPFADVRIEIRLDDPSDAPGAGVVYHIAEGPRVVLREMTVQGNSASRSDVLIREARLRPGELFSQSKADRLGRRLERLQLFTSVGEIQLYLLNDSTASDTLVRSGGLLCTVEEGNTTTFDGVLGYVPAATGSERGYLTGLVALTMKNIFGTGRRVGARWQRETSSTQELEFTYTEPWFLSIPLDLSVGYFQRKQDSLYVKSVVSARGDYNLTDELTFAGTVNAESIYPSADLTQFTVYESSSLFLGGEVRYDTRDNARAPTSGVKYSTSYQSGAKKITGPGAFIVRAGAKEYVTSRVAVDVDLYTMPWHRHVVAFGAHGRQVTSSVLELSDMYQFGGSATVRGYRESQFIGSRVAWTSLEYRFLTGRLSHVFAFADGGYFSRPLETANGIAAQEKLLTGMGIGARLETALGILGVSYAIGRGDSFSNGKIHFGIVNEF